MNFGGNDIRKDAHDLTCSIYFILCLGEKNICCNSRHFPLPTEKDRIV